MIPVAQLSQFEVMAGTLHPLSTTTSEVGQQFERCQNGFQTRVLPQGSQQLLEAHPVMLATISAKNALTTNFFIIHLLNKFFTEHLGKDARHLTIIFSICVSFLLTHLPTHI